jgi:hypothetical protein
VVLAAFKAAVRALRGPRRWVRLPHASAKTVIGDGSDAGYGPSGQTIVVSPGVDNKHPEHFSGASAVADSAVDGEQITFDQSHDGFAAGSVAIVSATYAKQLKAAGIAH